jgi:NADH-quinone oxidoreductase subunit J
MTDLLFYFFSLVALVAALVMVLNPNAVGGAMAMIVSFVATAALFVLLEAYFLAIIQVLVYAGAVMVLFLFIIMLLDVDKVETAYRFNRIGTLAAVCGFLLLGSMLVVGLSSTHLPVPPTELVTSNPDQVSQGSGIPFTSSSKSFGYSLFTKYMLPFQLVGFLLLAAMLGVIVISKRAVQTD